MREFRESWPEDDPPLPRRQGPENSLWSDLSELRPVPADGAGRRPEVAPALGRAALTGEVAGEESREPSSALASDARPEVARALGWAALAAEASSEPAEAGERVPPVPELDLEALRCAPAERERVSDPAVGWVSLDRVEPTDAVRGEPFKDGSDPAGYARELAEVHAHRDQSSPEMTRMAGDSRVRLSENPETGLLEVTGGRHRIQAAREAGLPEIIAEVRVWRHRREGDDA